ncbi:MAG: DEAD/DEAH box helicase [Nannocystaceae bacterium]
MIAIADHDEARREVLGMLDGSLGHVPLAPLVNLLMSSYADEGWVLLRDATLAVRRRARSAEVEQLKIAQRPAKRAVLGPYRTRRHGETPRPYRTHLHSLDPLHVSCSCPDYLKGGLGVCKHGIAVLHELGARPRVLARGHAEVPSTPMVWWDPIQPLRGPLDRLAALRVSEPARVGNGLRALLTTKTEPARLRPSSLRTAAARRKTVECLAALVERFDPDPALAAVVREELVQQDRGDQLLLPAKTLRRAQRSFRLELYPYQQESVRKFLASGRMLLADDMGLGKTIQAAAIAHLLVQSGRISRILIIAPASLKSQWVREWRKATPVPIEDVDGGPAQRGEQYASTSAGALVANYEQVLRDLDLIDGYAPELVILDEAQRIKNWQTQTARTIKRLDVPYRLVLTGTPLENRLDELASIMDWVDPHVMAPKWRLAAVHQVTSDGSREVLGVQNLEVLRARLAPRMVRRRRLDILRELPPRTDTVVPVELTDAQRLEHDELNIPIAQLVAMARRRPLNHQQFLRLMSLLTTQRIIANGLAQLRFESVWPGLPEHGGQEATLRALAMPKLEHLRALVQSLVVEQGRKIVVFSQWRRMLSLAHWAIGDILGDQGHRAAFFTGRESRKRRTTNVVEFHDEPSVSVLLCTDAGGVGLNLQRAASCCINLELPWNPAVLEQRIARIHRLGQSEPVDAYTLVTEDSIEERIAGIISSKRALFDGLFDGQSDEVTFAEASSFIATLGRMYPAQAPAVDPDESSDAGDDELGTEDAHVQQLVSEADEAGDPSAPPKAGLPAVGDIRRMLSELKVEPRADGGVRIDASPEAAQTLGALFTGMAQLLEQAAQES